MIILRGVGNHNIHALFVVYSHKVVCLLGSSLFTIYLRRLDALCCRREYDEY